MNIGTRIVYSAAAALVMAGVLFAAVRKWSVGTTNKDEIALFGGLMVGVIVFLLLTPQVQPQAGQQVSIPNAPVVPPLPPVVYNPGSFSIIPQTPQKPGGCGCGCNENNSTLSNIFNQIAQQFGATINDNEAKVFAAQMASVPNWLGQYYNNQVAVQQSVILQDFYSQITNAGG